VPSLTRIVIPIFEDVPFIPDIQVVYWVDTAILPSSSPTVPTELGCSESGYADSSCLPLSANLM
jgi:hypothetical protein